MSGVLRAVLIEAFSDRPCAGNGAAVVLLRHPWADQQLQALATSLRQSETAFLLQQAERWLLRWFTPTCEVRLCGHATLAAALALGHWGELPAGQEMQLHSRSGPLAVRRDPQHPWQASIDLPSSELRSAAIPEALTALLARHGLGAALGFWRSGLGYSVVLLEEQAALEQAQGIAADLTNLDDLAMGLVLMQAASDSVEPGAQVSTVAGQPVDYRLRFFAPGLGIPEDPVTGSAHALVAPWWQQQLQRDQVVGWQCSDRPGGMVCRGVGSGMIRLSGSGHLLWDGTLHTQPHQPPELDPESCGGSPPPLPLPEGWHDLSGNPC
ncbi:MAG: PhzF family phenazine biosynthesis protein [Synechococcus sp. ELA057]|jgi:predicted PhzF superfamily epimerase YddE/YHI9